MDSLCFSDQLWSKITPHLPKYKSSVRGGRPRLNLKKVFEGIVFIQSNKLPWKAAPEVFGSKTALNDYFREWAKCGFFHLLKEQGLFSLPELVNIDFNWEKIGLIHSESKSHFSVNPPTTLIPKGENRI